MIDSDKDQQHIGTVRWMNDFWQGANQPMRVYHNWSKQTGEKQNASRIKLITIMKWHGANVRNGSKLVVGSESGLAPNWNSGNGFYNIKKLNCTEPASLWPVLQFRQLRTLAAIKYFSLWLYHHIIYTSKMQFWRHFHLPFSNLRSDSYLWSCCEMMVKTTRFSTWLNA